MGFSTKSVNSMGNLSLNGANKVCLEGLENNYTEYNYEEIDYSQDIEVTVDNRLTEFKNEHGDSEITYTFNGEINTKSISDLVKILEYNDIEFEVYLDYLDAIDDTAAILEMGLFNQLLSYIEENHIDLDEDALDKINDINLIFNNSVATSSTMPEISKVEELTNLIGIFEAQLASLEEEIKPIEEAYNTAMINVKNPIIFMQDFNDEQLRIAEECRVQLEPLQADKAMLEAYIYQMRQELELAPYHDIFTSSECQEFLNSYNGEYSNYINSVDEEYIRQLKSDYDIAIINLSNSNIAGTSIWNDAYQTASSIEAELAVVENFLYISEEQRQTYIYLLETNPTKANEFLNALQDQINQAKGAEAAAKFIESLDLNDEGKLEESLNDLFGTTHNWWSVSTRGLGDGIDNFFEGLENCVINNDTLTVDDYTKMIILQYLQENSNYLDEVYEFSTSLGNMLPAMTASAIVSFCATPAAGSAVASTLMGLSAAGNAKHQALVGGNSVLSSTLYGIFVGASEATLGYFLGKIPGISATSGFTLSNLLSEGSEEFLQEWIDAGLQAIVLGQDVDWSSIPENAMKSFAMGFLMAGFLNGGQAIVNVTINGQNVNLNVEDTLRYIEAHPGVDVLDAIEEANPGFFDKIFKRKSTKFNDMVKYNYQQQYTNIENSVAAAGNGFVGVFQELQRVSNIGDIMEIRKTCRAAIQFYMDKMSVTEMEAAQNILEQYGAVLNIRGYDTFYDPDTGITYKQIRGLNTNYQTANITEFQQLVAQLPKEFTQNLKEVTINDTFNPADFYWELTYNMNDFTSAATGGYGTLNIWVPTGNSFCAGHISLNTIAHEIAHSYDTQMAQAWGLTGRISESSVWQDAMAKDLALNGKTGCSDYAVSSNSPHEDFAEAIALYYSNPNALDAFPNRKALIESYLPAQRQSIAHVYDVVYNAMINKYGENDANYAWNKYLQTGDTSYITRDGGARSLLSQFTVEEVRDYLYQIELDKRANHQKAVENSFELAFGALIRKYGAEVAVENMNAFLQTGDLSEITRAEGARDSISTFDVSDFRDYVRSINNGSLDVSSLLGGN